jgi:hypothetical protein
MADKALFERDGDMVVATPIARGPWRPDALHGGAVAALLASALDVPDRTPVRITFDLLAAVPTTPLRLVTSQAEGGSRVVRQMASLFSGENEVATAQCLAIRFDDIEPPALDAPPDPFEGIAVPDLSQSRPKVAEMVGWDCFDSAAVSARTLQANLPGYATGVYVSLLVPVVAGEKPSTVARAAAAADYASNHLATRFNFDQWSFMNADLTLHLSRVPEAAWIGLVSTGVVASNGSGLSVAQMFDTRGRLGQSVQSLVVESRARAAAGA